MRIGVVKEIKQDEYRVALTPAGDQAPALWAVTSTPVVPDAKVRLVNFASVESAQRYGPQVEQWIANGEKVIYVGPLPAGSKAPGLEKHFTDEHFKLGGDDVQVVRVHAGDQVLAEEGGKPGGGGEEGSHFTVRYCSTLAIAALQRAPSP